MTYRNYLDFVNLLNTLGLILKCLLLIVLFTRGLNSTYALIFAFGNLYLQYYLYNLKNYITFEKLDYSSNYML
jgi:hypothetical protein